MEYELAKELKDAGFKQNQDDPREDAYIEGGIVKTQHGDELTIIVYNPSLSELIEACGEGFYKLIKISAKEPFYAYNDVQDIVVAGSTPEEAVARLWLALNKK